MIKYCFIDILTVRFPPPLSLPLQTSLDTEIRLKHIVTKKEAQCGVTVTNWKLKKWIFYDIKAICDAQRQYFILTSFFFSLPQYRNLEHDSHISSSPVLTLQYRFSLPFYFSHAPSWRDTWTVVLLATLILLPWFMFFLWTTLHWGLVHRAEKIIRVQLAMWAKVRKCELSISISLRPVFRNAVFSHHDNF